MYTLQIFDENRRSTLKKKKNILNFRNAKRRSNFVIFVREASNE